MMFAKLVRLCLVAAVAAAAGEQDGAEEACALQLPRHEVLAQVDAKDAWGTKTCSIGDKVVCPGSSERCAGNQCCPRWYDGVTFPCPSADPDWVSDCESSHKRANCVVGPAPTPAPPPTPAPEAPLHCPGSPPSGSWPFELSGFYHDLKDNDNKNVEVSREESSKDATMVITPAEPGTEYYVDGVGESWLVTAAVEDDCTAPSINFDVENKPNPPDHPVAATFQFGKLSDLDFVQECLKPDASADYCGAAAEYPQIHCDRPVWALNFGGNVWVMDGAPTLGPAPDGETLDCDGSPVTKAVELSGFYRDLIDYDIKKIEVGYVENSESAIMVITPPEQCSEFYTAGVGEGWTVTATVEESCVAPRIIFDVCGKPNPPDFPVKATFQYGKLSDLDFVQECLKDASADHCGAVAGYPQIHCDRPVWALNFGGNVWVRDGAPALGPAPDAETLHCDGSSATEAFLLSGFYHDLHDNDNKHIEVGYVSESAIMVITPPEPVSEFYTAGVGKGWTVTASVEESCAAPSIIFDVCGKPNPPGFAVKAKFEYGKLSDLDFVQECLKPGTTKDCGSLAEYPQIHCDRPVWALNFGGNVWVLGGAPTLGPAPATEALHCDGRQATKAVELSGFYRDLHDNDNKKVEVGYVSGSAIMVITPPEPGSEFYTPGVGKGWTVTASVEESCVVPRIIFDVCGKPTPPGFPVKATFQYGKLSDLEFVQECLKPGTSKDCGAAAGYSGIHSDTPVWALNFGGNVWVLQ